MTEDEIRLSCIFVSAYIGLGSMLNTKMGYDKGKRLFSLALALASKELLDDN